MSAQVASIELRHLAVHIATCPIVDLCLTDNSLAHPCQRVVRQNNPTRESPRALPEPWYGHLGQAPILFVSSNPGGGRPKYRPDPDDVDAIVARAEDAFEGLTKGTMDSYWGAVLGLAAQLLAIPAADVRPGVDYAITEVVHCGSAGEEAGEVNKAVFECAPRYTPILLRLAAARVIVLVGAIARDWFSYHLPLAHPLRFGEVSHPEIVEGRSRIFISVAHPSRVSRAPKKLRAEQISAARLHLASLARGT